ncbi:outer membrane insertion C- signal [Draconibacterium mangrovi]|uniref:outer membrane insertion C- signal n=1 Tax=Draconibacterium mangrovi TaxID=2697469 RepID=UPI0013D57B58|nr:outer membrane insertion C- signal [Draconibacterium mangrovi]
MKKTMVKFIAVLAIVIGGVVSSNAQELGVRFGDISGGNVAIDGIFSTGQFSRIHGDVSFGNGFGVDLLWDFFYRPLSGEAFNWYMGVGPYLGVFDIGNDDDEFNLGAAFEIGLEYHFNSIPIALGVDYRPALEIIEDTDFHAGDFGFNIRYVFGQ